MTRPAGYFTELLDPIMSLTCPADFSMPGSSTSDWKTYSASFSAASDSTIMVGATSSNQSCIPNANIEIEQIGGGGVWDDSNIWDDSLIWAESGAAQQIKVTANAGPCSATITILASKDGYTKTCSFIVTVT